MCIMYESELYLYAYENAFVCQHTGIIEFAFVYLSNKKPFFAVRCKLDKQLTL